MPTDFDKLTPFQMATIPMSFPASMKREALVGETIDFASRSGDITAIAVTRKPATSAATVAALLYTPDVPGLYRFTLTTTMGVVYAALLVAPTAIVGFNYGPRIESCTFVSPLVVTRMHLRGVAHEIDRRITEATTAASIELPDPPAGPPNRGPSLGYNERLFPGFNWRVYG